MSGVAVMGRSRRASGRGGTPASVFRAQGRQQPARWGVLVGVRGRRDHRGPRTGGRVPQWSGPARATARPQLQVGGPRRHRTGRDLGTPGQRVATLEQAVSPLAASSIAELDDDQIRAELTSVEDVERRPRPTLLPARRGTDRPVSPTRARGPAPAITAPPARPNDAAATSCASSCAGPTPSSSGPRGSEPA
jgi:hypothetical protein